MLQQYNCTSSRDVGDDDWALSGAQLCQLSVTEVQDRFPRDAGIVLAELQLWKNFGPLGKRVKAVETRSDAGCHKIRTA